MTTAGAARWLLRIFGAIFLLAIALVAAVALLLPSLLAGEGAASRIRDAAFEATGSHLEWNALDVALFPPALALDGARATAAELGPEPWLAAQRIELRLAWLPLLARTVLVDALSVEGVELALRRDIDGWVIPGAAQRGTTPPDPSAAPRAVAPAAESAGPSFSLALRRVRLRDGVVRLADHSFPKPHRIELREVRADLEATDPTDPVALELRAVFATGGELRLDGAVSAERDLTFQVNFQDVSMELLQPYLQQELALAGRATGAASLTGAAAALERVELTLRSDDAAVMSEELSASGPLTLELSLDDVARPSGHFSFDATRATLVYQAVFRKPAGVEATAAGSFRTRNDGTLDVDFDKVRIKDAAARGELRSGSRPSFAMRTEAPIELEGWGAMVPALAGLRGRAALPEFTVAWPRAGEPPSLQGRVLLQDLAVALDDAAARTLVLHGELLAQGGTVTSRDLIADFAGQTIPVTLRVDDLLGAPRWRVDSALAGVDANTLASAWAGTPDTIFGTLSLDASVGAPIAVREALPEALGGKLALRIEPGRLRGVSLLRSATDSIGPLAETALLAGQLYGGRTLQRFFEDEFTSLTGTFELRDGRAHTRDLRLVYRLYQIDLHGNLGLADGSLDLDGSLTLFDMDESGETPQRKARRSFPLAGIRGTVSKPRVQIAPEAAVAWVAGLRGSPGGPTDRGADRPSRLEREIDERLGTGSGREILDALEGVLGSGSRR